MRPGERCSVASRAVRAGFFAIVLVSLGCSGGTGQPAVEAASPRGGVLGAAVPDLSVPPGFRITYVSQNVPGARFMAFAPNGDLVVAETSRGNLVVIPHGKPTANPIVFASGLALPHGLAFYRGQLYVATWSGVIRYAYPAAAAVTLFADLPQGGDHNRRALVIAADGTVYVSSGSDCNICDESDPRFATVLRYAPGDASATIFAKGLRNASGLAFDAAGRLWAVVNQRDNIGPTQAVTDNLPPDELDLVRQGEDFGWPQCYPDPNGSDRLPNPEYSGASCAGQTPAALNFQAHSAPLDIVFYYGTQFPDSYRGDAFVAFHGSWNRSVPTGDKVVVVHFSGGRPTGYSDFATGWLQNGSYHGRPAGLAVAPDGSLYISDDQQGAVYRVTYTGIRHS